MRINLPLLLTACLPALNLIAAFQWDAFDISSLLHEEEQAKIQYQDQNGQVRRLEQILKDNGANALKVRLFVNPSDGRYNLDYALRIGRRVRDIGLPMVLNLHYSDTWAHPAQQTKPSQWNGLNDQQVQMHPVYASTALTQTMYSSLTVFAPTRLKSSMLSIAMAFRSLSLVSVTRSAGECSFQLAVMIKCGTYSVFLRQLLRVYGTVLTAGTPRL